MKKLLSLTFTLVLLLGLCISASAAELPRVIDNAGLLTQTDIEVLTEMSLALKEKYAIDAIVLTVDSLNGKAPQGYASDYYDHNGYADDGVLFLLSMEERDYYVDTTGEVIYALTDYALYEMENTFLGDLSDGAYYDAFCSYLRDVDYYMDAYKESGAIDGVVPEEDRYYAHDTVVYSHQRVSAGTIWMTSAGIGLVVAGIALLIMRGSMNTKQKQYSAEDYLKAGSYNLTKQRDVFLYSQVTKQRKPEQNNSSGGGGGSGVHRSSSGRIHGGRGGKF